MRLMTLMYANNIEILRNSKDEREETRLTARNRMKRGMRKESLIRKPAPMAVSSPRKGRNPRQQRIVKMEPNLANS